MSDSPSKRPKSPTKKNSEEKVGESTTPAVAKVEAVKGETFKTAIPFMAYAALVTGILLNYDTCNIHVPKRKDCGYSGISMTECSIYGKWSSQNADGPREIIRCFAGWLSLAFVCWVVSRLGFTKRITSSNPYLRYFCSVFYDQNTLSQNLHLLLAHRDTLPSQPASHTSTRRLRRYDMQSVLMYVMLAVMATFHQTSCCYDGSVPGGVPHCYC